MTDGSAERPPDPRELQRARLPAGSSVFSEGRGKTRARLGKPVFRLGLNFPRRAKPDKRARVQSPGMFGKRAPDGARESAPDAVSLTASFGLASLAFSLSPLRRFAAFGGLEQAVKEESAAVDF